MSIVTPSAPFTPEELSRLPDAVNYELVGGVLVERNMGMESSGVGARILFLIALFLRDHKVGHVFGADAGYQCFQYDPKAIRKADVSIIRLGRLEGEHRPKGYCRIPPDLAVEVISPRDLADEVEEKVTEYLDAGVKLVWVVYPSTRHVRIHRHASSSLGPVSELTEKDSITGEDILPGFTCPVSEFFQE